MYATVKQGRITGTTSRPTSRSQRMVNENSAQWKEYVLGKSKKSLKRDIQDEVARRLPAQAYADQKKGEVDAMTQAQVDAYDPETDTNWP
jgi:hypothetical protein